MSELWLEQAATVILEFVLFVWTQNHLMIDFKQCQNPETESCTLELYAGFTGVSTRLSKGGHESPSAHSCPLWQESSHLPLALLELWFPKRKILPGLTRLASEKSFSGELTFLDQGHTAGKRQSREVWAQGVGCNPLSFQCQTVHSCGFTKASERALHCCLLPTSSLQPSQVLPRQ